MAKVSKQDGDLMARLLGKGPTGTAAADRIAALLDALNDAGSKLEEITKERDGYRTAVRAIADENGATILELERQLKKVKQWKSQWSHDLPDGSAVFQLNEILFGRRSE